MDMKKLENINEYVLFGFLSIICYKKAYFRNLNGFSRIESVAFLIFLLVVSIAVNILCNNSKRNEIFHFMVSLCLPYEIYYVLSFYHAGDRLMRILWIAVLVISAFFCIMIFARKIQNKNQKKEIIKRRLKFAVFGIQNILAVSIIIFLTISNMGEWFRGIEFAMAEKNAGINYEKEYTVKRCKETLAKLQQDVWETLSRNEKLELLFVIAEIEADYLGLPHQLFVEVKEIEDEETLGYYTNEKNTIYIDETAFETSQAYEVLGVMLHEAYHAYQLQAVKVYRSVDNQAKRLLMFRGARSYEWEFINYIDGDEDFDTYYEQQMEEDARKYSEERKVDYYKAILGMSES